jgi:hypothetical protein
MDLTEKSIININKNLVQLTSSDAFQNTIYEDDIATTSFVIINNVASGNSIVDILNV